MSLIPGRTYHRRYGYPWRWAILAEFWWRMEHWLPRGDLKAWAYRHRKDAEYRGWAAV